MNDDRPDEVEAVERDLQRAKREYDEAERNMVEGWKRRLPIREQAELIDKKNRAWTNRENVLGRLKVAASRAAD